MNARLLPSILLATLAAVGSTGEAARSPYKLTLPLHAPSNVYWHGSELLVASTVTAEQAGPAVLTLVLTDYLHAEVARAVRTLDLPARTAVAVEWRLAELPDGYYQATVSAVPASTAEAQPATLSTSLVIAPHIERSAAQAKAAGSRIGLKMWYSGPAWWRGQLDWDERAAVGATTGLGLQWTRALLQEGDKHLSTIDLIHDFPMNVMFKVERFPAELYDADRYGPMADYEAKNGKGVWTLKTLPKKEPYQAWLREQVAKLPPEQNVFEIWNEAWDKMSAEDLATLCNWIGEAILADRPDAIIGPNIKGETSRYEYDARLIDAGGMRGMRMISLHPYGNSENRAWMRDYQAWARAKVGHDVAIYVTEYGAHSCPEGPSKRSEEQQARDVVTQTLNLYAEGVVAMAPHVMGQREEKRNYHEDWFGFFRLDNTPKPALAALATCARMIDGGSYVGDLWFGPGIGAMLYEKQGVRALALYTKSGTQRITLDATPGLRLVDMVGTPRPLTPVDGTVAIEIGLDVQYVLGIGDALAATASRALRADLWPDRAKTTQRTVRSMSRLGTPPTIDGNLGEWKELLQIGLVNEKVNGDDASGLAGTAWDDTNLYLAYQIRDNQILNKRPLPKLYQQDSIEMFLSTEVREGDAGYGPNDHQFWLAPISVDGKPLLVQVAERSSGKLTAIPGATFAVVVAKPGWTAEIAIPWKSLGFTPTVGSSIALDMRLNDADESHERWKVDPLDSQINTENPTMWAELKLGE
jgi:hypothetical protein